MLELRESRMIVRLHAFDWKIYNKRIMPALHLWLMNDDEQAVTKLYMSTQRAKAEEQRVTPLQRHSSWLQAQAFVKRLPRGPHALDEYTILCTPERFTPLSDRYMYRYPPQLHRNSEALRVIWSALIEEYCLPWFQITDEIEKFLSSIPRIQQDPLPPEALRRKAPFSSLDQHSTEEKSPSTRETIFRSELITLLQSAGLAELVQAIIIHHVDEKEVPHYASSPQRGDTLSQSGNPHKTGESKRKEKSEEDEEEESGILIGQQPAPIRLRGWLASFSIRAMALFELLACGRRCMPFGYEASDLATGYIGYLTPDEVWQLALCLRKVQSPRTEQVAADFQQFQKRLREKTAEFRMLDEVLPEYSEEFISLVRMAALQGLGLICSVG